MIRSIFFIAAALLAAPAAAQTSASVTVGTDYVARGTSQTYGGPGVLVYAEHQFDNGIYIGGIAANVDFDDGTKVEADVIGGIRTSVGSVNLDIGGIYITYHGDQTMNWNMGEVWVSASRTFGSTTVGAKVSVSPDYFNYGGKALWAETMVSQPVSDKVVIGGSIAYQYIERDFDYVTWNAGVTYSVTPTLSADLRYYDTDWSPIGNRYLDAIYEPRAVVSLRKAF